MEEGRMTGRIGEEMVVRWRWRFSVRRRVSEFENGGRMDAQDHVTRPFLGLDFQALGFGGINTSMVPALHKDGAIVCSMVYAM